ncbi:hypothetical protein BVRB_9g225610 [Beta vulgaris subsp. vulgaris]|uniref:Glycosyltransferase n=1 Tax=Beta vulgaris subsp. vulgaris TaxID=3555 RepID=A0A0J8DZU5_BETVV|nr:hypothetical protein BVRB_9g225610 [Beta vulgaris subsp. vulgaris]
MEIEPQLLGSSNPPHILIFPLPMQGPVNSMLKLAELLILSADNIHATFLTTDVVYHQLIVSARAKERFDRNPRFSFRTFSDGLPNDHPRGGDKFLEMLDAVKAVSHPIVREIVSSGDTHTSSSETNQTLEVVLSPLVTCIVSDGLYNFALDVGNEVGIPVFYFETMSPSCLWVYLCLPKLVEAGEVPFTENSDLDALLVNVPGMDGYLRRRDLPDFCRARDATDDIMLQRVLGQVQQMQRAQGIILNTFEDLDSHLLSYMRSHCSIPIYTIGPLHSSLKERLQANALSSNQPFVYSDHSNSLWQEDRNCMAWLDKQPLRSVIFCSFGSQVVITKEQLTEFLHGLVDSKTLFLWMNRPGSVIGLEENYEMLEKQVLMHGDLLKGIKKNGCIVSWVPQVEVLSHPAIGGFLTHGGWNSVIESVVAGVPMVCWPHYVDQLVNSRLATEVWKLGVDIKDSCNRAIVEKVVRDIMCLRRDELLENATKMANLASTSVQKGGTSYESMKNLIKDMESLTSQI